MAVKEKKRKKNGTGEYVAYFKEDSCQNSTHTALAVDKLANWRCWSEVKGAKNTDIINGNERMRLKNLCAFAQNSCKKLVFVIHCMTSYEVSQPIRKKEKRQVEYKWEIHKNEPSREQATQ